MVRGLVFRLLPLNILLICLRGFILLKIFMKLFYSLLTKKLLGKMPLMLNRNPDMCSLSVKRKKRYVDHPSRKSQLNYLIHGSVYS